MAKLEWKILKGKVLNKTAFDMVADARAIQLSPRTAAKQSNKLALSSNEQIEIINFNAAQYILNHQPEIHAICEARERKRNEQLGMPPSFSEAKWIVERPEEEAESSSAPQLSDFIDPRGEISQT
jgi:hypothetical protein